MSKIVVRRSNCCNSGVEVKHGKGKSTRIYVTSWWECLECHEPCDVHTESWDVDEMKGEDEEPLKTSKPAELSGDLEWKDEHEEAKDND